MYRQDGRKTSRVEDGRKTSRVEDDTCTNGRGASGTGNSFSEALILESITYNMTRDCSLKPPKNTSSQVCVQILF